MRLSNVDSIQYKDFGNATRYDHAIGVTHLALRIASLRRLPPADTAHLALAALLHDVGTPPFGHTLELVFDDVDHELEAWNALGIEARGAHAGFNAVHGELPQFPRRCAGLSELLGVNIRPEAVGDIVNGYGELGYLIKGTLDLDNTDNVIRGSHYMGLSSPGGLAEELTAWLSTVNEAPSLDGHLPQVARQWVELRDEYYRLFYDCSEEEQGRQALLQFLIREAHRRGLSKVRLLRTTDEELIRTIYDFAQDAGESGALLADAVGKYRRLEALPKVGELQIDERETIDAFRVRWSISWTEERLRQPGFVPILFYARRRFPESLKPPGSLFDYPAARLVIFALYEPKRKVRWPNQAGIAPEFNDLSSSILAFSRDKPWREYTDGKRDEVRGSLASWGNWGFLGSRNESMHSYPSTFVHAIPAAFIKSLTLAGDTIVDPFCGSGVTGVEAAKAGCSAVCSDINEVALLTSRVRVTYLNDCQRHFIASLDEDFLRQGDIGARPQLPTLEKWHHANTIEQLCQILGSVQKVEDDRVRDFLMLSFSAILTSTTARRGREHGWFADNTPLAKGESAPPYIDAHSLFLTRIRRNLRLLAKYYAELSRSGDSPEHALGRVQVLRANAATAHSRTYGLEPHSVGGIITSPPYLAMSDYTLGHRLSYAWLWPDLMERDFDEEIGARRRRFNGSKALADYVAGLEKFACLSSELLRPGGFLALVLGAPQAKRFEGIDLLGSVHQLFLCHGFELVWEASRPISWHRNHGYSHLKMEQLSVLVKR